MTSRALEFILDFVMSQKGKMEPSVVIDNMRDIVTAADYLSINRDGLVEFTSEFDDPYKAFAVVCALDPRDQAVQQAVRRTFEVPLSSWGYCHEDSGDEDIPSDEDDYRDDDNGDDSRKERSERRSYTVPDRDNSSDDDDDDDKKRLKEIKKMMEDKAIYGDFYDRLVRSQKTCEEHMDNLEQFLQAGFDWVLQIEEEVHSFSPWGICRPTPRNRRRGCAAYRKFDVFGDMVFLAKRHVMEDIRSHGSTHFAYEDPDYAYRLLSSMIPCRKCIYHLGESFQHEISTYPPDEENWMDDNSSTGCTFGSRSEHWLETQCYREVPDDFPWGEEFSVEDDGLSGCSDGEFTDDDCGWA